MKCFGLFSGPEIFTVHIYEKLYPQINILVLLDSLVTRNQGLQTKWQAPKLKRQALFFVFLRQNNAFFYPCNTSVVLHVEHELLILKVPKYDRKYESTYVL